MSIKVAIYARYSSDNQREASIEDQLRLASEHASSCNWGIYKTYTDSAISGATMLRPGIQRLLDDAMEGKFHIILAEALDRLSRDQEDTAAIYKRMEFLGIKIITLAEGEITPLHVGLKGTMNAMFLKDLADKTRRGQRGRVEQGKNVGAVPYGYRVVRSFDANGEVVRGEREIVEEQAPIIIRIFKEYAYENKSPKAIAEGLNEDGVPSPTGKGWAQSTLNGNRKRRVGILNSELYIGRMIWNRRKALKDPITGKAVYRYNDESQWIFVDVPELRIVPQELWDAAKARQKKIDRTGTELWAKRRGKFLLSGLMKCSVCGGNYSKVNRTHYACSNAKNKGDVICSNNHTIRQDVLEGLVLDALKTRLMRDDLVKVFCDEYVRHMNDLSKQSSSSVDMAKKEKTKLIRQKENIIKAVKDGLPASSFMGELEDIEKRLSNIEASLSLAENQAQTFLHPSMATRYHEAISELQNLLKKEDKKGEAIDQLRCLIDKVVLTPRNGEKYPAVDLYGDLAGILNISMDEKDTNKSAKSLSLLPFANNNDDQNIMQDSVGRASAVCIC